MSKFSKGHNSRKIRQSFFKFNQVIYSSSPISWPSFKFLAQILFKLSCWQDFVLIFSEGHNSRREITRTRKKYGSAIFPWEIHIWISRFLTFGMHEISFWFLSKGHNSRKGDNSDKKKKSVSAIFPWGIYIWNFKTLACTVLDERTDAQSETNMPRQLLRSWGHRKTL